ncbi:MAG: zinc ABC transporter substrate-binding protein [Kiritimatiellae bacterium]|nr:zinc ABC transporter substrate-binding protein [Kiritimatiellia bacterium]
MKRRIGVSTIGLRGLVVVIGLIAVRGAEARPVVFVSIPPQAWLVKRLAGDAAEVQTLLAAGVNPHTYEPNSRQLRKLAEASLYLTVGMPFEAPLAERAGALNPSLAVAAMDTGIAKRGAHVHGHDHDHGAPGHICGGAGGDPHIWLAPRLMCAMASNTVTALERTLPALRPGLAERLAATVAEIRATDAVVRERLAGLRTRAWVVYHPSWSYFAESYGLMLLAVEEDGKTPSARHLAAVIRQAREAGVRAVFTEPQYDRRPVTTLARQVGARLEVIDPLAEAWPELMRDVAAKLAAGDAP